MAKEKKTVASKPGPTSAKGIRIGGGIITAIRPVAGRAPKTSVRRGVRVGGGIITANMP